MHVPSWQHLVLVGVLACGGMGQLRAAGPPAAVAAHAGAPAAMPATATPTSTATNAAPSPWRMQSSGTPANLDGVSCPSTTICYAVGDYFNRSTSASQSTIVATTNGGATWISQLATTSGVLQGVSCPSTTTCYAVGYSIDPQTGTEAGAIMATTNGGTTWTAQSPTTDAELSSVSCPSTTTCYAVGRMRSTYPLGSATILATTDGGATWTTQRSINNNNLTGVSCPTTTICFATEYYNGGILATTNGGATWTKQTPGTTATLYGVSCPSIASCYAVGFDNGGAGGSTILATTDGGVTWAAQSPNTTTLLWSVSCPSTTDCGVAGYGGSILITTDGGATWGAQSSGTTANLTGVSCPTSTTCYAVGASGSIVATAGGGVGAGGTTPATASATATETATATMVRGSTTPTAPAGPPVMPTVPACLGPRDLIIDGAQIALGGGHTFDRVCIVHGATVLARGLTLRAGVVYLDATSRIDADGLPGGPAADSADGCSQAGNGKPGGDDGSPLTILAHQAIVLGAISSNGGGANTAACADYRSGEQGGRGGRVTLEAALLSFSGAIAARGGDGGPSPDGDGGDGGTISVLLPAGARAPAGSLDVSGGKPGTSGDTAATPGRPGQAGSVSVAALTAAQRAALPPAPAAPLRILGQAPARLPLQPAGAFAAGLRCGAGDLDVGRGAAVRLDGVQRFAHVCIHDGGALTTDGRLTLIASTIAVGAGSRISADGVSRTAGGPARRTGAPVTARALPPPGMSGAAGTAADVCCGGTSQPPAGGAGGGAIALVARTVLLAGSLSAEGASGGKGDDGLGTPSNCGTGGQGAGGGAGGGIYIRAATLQLSGRISVAGGTGGAGGRDECLTEGTGVADGGAHGAPGLVMLLADTLRAAAGALPIAGPAALGRTLPVDPAPPPDVPGAQYTAAIGAGPNATLLGHSLAGPFLAFYRRYGGLAAMGYPRTEPFMEGGHRVQYTERFLLQLAGGAAVTAPLGRRLTAGRAYATVAPFASTPARRFFGATGHSLSGRFLAFWMSHHGATLLGAPISEVVREQNGDGSGRTYPLQWFEKGRLEYHADLAGTPYAVQIGLLGTQALRQRGWLP